MFLLFVAGLFASGLIVTLGLYRVAGMFAAARRLGPYPAAAVATVLPGIGTYVWLAFLCGSSCREMGLGPGIVVLSSLVSLAGASAGVMVLLRRNGG